MARSRGGTSGGEDDDTGAPDRVDLHVGARIRMRRLLLGLNQQGLARKLGITFQQVQKYENGANRVSASRLSEIAEALGIRVGYFFLDLDESGDPATPEETLWQQRIGQTEALELVRHYYAIPDPRVREHFLELIKAAASAKPATKAAAKPAD
jgi:transcriptional regulator with XRE-family HTH domain